MKTRRLPCCFAVPLLLAGSLAVQAFGARATKGPRATLAERQFRVSRDCEVGLRITARAPGTSWGKKGAEAAVVTLIIDGQYSQDLILFNGAKRFTYRVLLGRVSAGRHTLTIEINKRQSSAGAGSVLISKIDVEPLEHLSSTKELAIEHAPLLFARRDSIGRYTDIPILMWYEVFNKDGETTIRYSYVFTNEDAGTASDALMARWGRATDIEWAYEIRLKGSDIVDERFQAVNHKDTAFRGKKVALHPLLLVASDNNNFADSGDSAMRFQLWPEYMDLSKHSREEIMDLHPWAYAVMAQELYRERKISDSGGHLIRDPRDYVYIEADAPAEDIGVDLKIKLKDGRWFDSDLGRDYLRITREGWFRVAVRLPQGERAMDAREIALDCHPVREQDRARESYCSRVTVSKVFALTNRYTPKLLRLRADKAGLPQSTGSR